ncbi:MAG: hypothetical protein M1430_15720 [Betaproteobacteria bacterium]|nr:hypothetical protein [Betaproteobacteria bacterium]
MRKAFFVFAAAILVGCQATAPQQPKKSSLDDPSRNCFDAMGYNTQLRTIDAKVGGVSDIKKATIEHLSRTDTATNEDKALISLWASERNRCTEAGAEFRKTHQPLMYAGLVESQNEEFIVLLSKLYSGSITYGQFNTMRKELSVKNNERWRQALVSEKQAQSAQQQVRAAERAQNAAEFNNAMLLMQAARPAPMPFPSPNFGTSCQSRVSGGTLYTNCN